MAIEDPRHADDLMRILEHVCRIGWAFVEWPKLYMWYGVEKIRKEPYRDINLKWAKVTTKGRKLRLAEVYGGLLFISRPVKDIDAHV